MDNRTTMYPFLLFILLSWFLELVLGWLSITWYWGTTWFLWGEPGLGSIAQVVVSLFSSTGNWTVSSVLLFFFVIYIVVHILFVISCLVRPLVQHWNLGVRQPVEQEIQHFEQTYAAVAQSALNQVQRPRMWRVAEGSGLGIRWQGYMLIIDRELFSHRFFPPLLAHSLAAANSEERVAHRLYEMLPKSKALTGILCGFPFGIGHLLLYPAWMWYWRSRVYAADLFAVECGQGQELLRVLQEIYLKIDVATKGGRVLKPTPYVAERISRIERALAQHQAGSSRVV